MRVLVFEPDPTGHHFAYLRFMLPAIAALAGEVTLATVRDARRAESFAMLEPVLGAVKVDDWIAPPAGGVLSVARARLGALRQSIRRSRAEHVYVPYADGVGQLAAISHAIGRPVVPRGVHAEGLWLRGGFAYPAPNPIAGLRARAGWFAAARAPWRVHFHLDPLAYERVRAAGGPMSQCLRLMPDPIAEPRITDRAEARRRLGVPVEGRYVGTVGMLDGRKGVDLLVRAFDRARLGPADWLLLVGRHAPEVSAAIAACSSEARSRIVSLDRFVGDDELEAAVAASDVVCTPYPRHVGSASIVIRAAAAGRPVLGSSFGWIGEMIGRFGLGRAIEVTRPEVFAGAVRAMLEEATGFVPTEGSRRFVRFHRPGSFAAAWTAHLRQRLGLPPEPAGVSWDWVMEAAAPGSPPAH